MFFVTDCLPSVIFATIAVLIAVGIWRDHRRVKPVVVAADTCDRCGGPTVHYCAMVCVDMCPKCDTLDAKAKRYGS